MDLAEKKKYLIVEVDDENEIVNFKINGYIWDLGGDIAAAIQRDSKIKLLFYSIVGASLFAEGDPLNRAMAERISMIKDSLNKTYN